VSDPQAAGPIEPILVEARHDDSTAHLELLMPDDLLYFRGHFPNFPVLPGIVQTHWAVSYARRYLPIGTADVTGVQVKFKRVIGPNMRVGLNLAYALDRRRLAFEYREADRPCSSGTITFGAA
jgi:3-hydroxymyristoyl/3-hydroxydecanoyl-(acyl carrier protein) dehydratase